MSRWPRNLPWIDGLAGLTAGVIILALRGVLASFYGLSVELVTFVGAVNVLYSTLGLSLGSRRQRPAALLFALVVANLGWTAVCVALAARTYGEASIFGLLHLLGEGAFVAGLALLELRYRREILAPPAAFNLRAAG